MKALNKTQLLASGLLSLGLVMTGCANTNTQPKANAKPMPHQQEKHMKADKKERGDKKEREHEQVRGDEHHFEKLNLTDAQKQQLEALAKQNDAKLEQLFNSVKQQDENIAKQKQAGADTATLLKLYQQREATMEQAKALHDQAEKQFMSILTPEQQLKLYEAHDKQFRPDMKKPNGQVPPAPPAPPADAPKPKM